MIRKRVKRKKTDASHFKICPFCGVPFEFTKERDRRVYDWYVNNSQLWQNTREWALQRAEYKCEKCGVSFPLQVHHKSYSRLGKEHPDDLVVLCQDCHDKEHMK